MPRSFPLTSVLLLALLTACGCTVNGGESESAAERPNVLFLFADDHRTDAIGAYGNPYIHTPHLDSLVQAGFNFREAHIMGSHHGAVCAPSRAMLMSGRELYHVYDDLDTVRTFPQQMREDGYVTFGTGKWHQSGEAFAKSFSRGRHVFLGGMSDHFNVPVRDLLPDGSFTEVDSAGFSSTLFANATIGFLNDYASSDTTAPFLAYTSFTAPHDPRTPPQEYLEMYDGAGMPLPPSFKPVHPFNLGPGTLTLRDEQLAPWPRSPEVVRSQIAEYYGLISHMDAQIGRIFDALRANGLAENTIVVFAGDNGLAVGSHGLLGKQSLYEHSTRVPLLVSGPGVPSGESDALVTLYDLAPTLLDLTNSEPLPRMDGTNLAPIWRGQRDAVREMLYTAYGENQRAIRGDRWKLIYYPKIDHTQLFDLRRDPYELWNRAGAPEVASVQNRMRDSLGVYHRRADDPNALSPEETMPFRFDYSQAGRSPDRHQPTSIVEKYFSN